MAQEAIGSSVQVEIFDKTFNLHGDPGYILKLAQYVEAKMHDIAERNPEMVGARLAVFAALNIAEDYHLLKTKLEGFTDEERQRAREKRQRHYTKRWAEQKLLANVNDESLPPKERHEDLLALCRLRGYLRAPKTKR